LTAAGYYNRLEGEFAERRRRFWPMKNNIVLRFVLLVILIIVSVYLFFYFDLHLFFSNKNKIIEFIKDNKPYSEIVFIVIQIFQVAAAPIPGEMTGFIGGYIFGPVLGTIYSTVGLTLGSWLAFALAHFFGMPLLEKVVNAEVVRKFDHFMEHQGILVSLALFLIPGFPKDYLCYIMGVSRMPVATFLIISTAGRFFGTAMLSVSGSFARNEQYILLAILAFASLAAIGVVYYYRDELLEIIKTKSKKPATGKKE